MFNLISRSKAKITIQEAWRDGVKTGFKYGYNYALHLRGEEMPVDEGFSYQSDQPKVLIEAQEILIRRTR